MLHEAITDRIIRCYYHVYNTLGYGFLEKIYENALVIKLRSEGFICLQQPPIDVYFEGETVGTYFADILVDGKIILEIKAGNAEHIVAHECQLINYLKATGMEIGLLLFFGRKSCVKRKIFTHY
ncbi:MAG: GxxExxY protein [Ferruginibacter sp.]